MKSNFYLTKLNPSELVELETDEDAPGLRLQTASRGSVSREVSGTNLVRKGSVLEAFRDSGCAW
jgi:hypothetical protein